jgi:hypothetical protein
VPGKVKDITGQRFGLLTVVRLHDTRNQIALRRNMAMRCYDPSNKRWANYGGRGIAVCDEWLRDRRAFYQWCMDAGFRPGLQIDRIDTNGNYEPGNCRFVGAVEQANNTTRNHFIEWQGQRLTVAQWARRLGVRSRALQARLARKWPVERVMTQPFREPRYPR